MTGRAQVNTWLANLFVDFPLIDIFKLCDRVWTAAGASEDYYLLLNASGYPTRMAAGAATYATFVIGYLTTSDPWVLTWTGDATVSMASTTTGITTTLSLSSSNRREYTITSASRPLLSSFRALVSITAIPTGVSNIRVFRKSQESLLNAGNKFNPDFLDLYRGFGRIRFMDWNYTNINPIAQWGQRTTESNMCWQGFNIYPDVYCGTCVRVGTDFTAPQGPASNPTSWSQGDIVQAALPSVWPALTAIQTFSNGVAPNVRADAHGLTTGDIVYFFGMPGSSLSGTANFINKTEGKFWGVTVVDVDNFTVDAMDSTSWGAYTSGGTVGKRVTFTAGSLPTKPLLSNSATSVGRNTLSNNLGAVFNLMYDSTYDGLVMSLATSDPIGRGFPWETLIDLANELQVSPWFCIPSWADTDFATQAATLVRDNLDTDLVSIWEYTNEDWNIGGGLIPTGVSSQLGKELFGVLGTIAVNTHYGYKVYQMMDAIATVFAGQTDRIQRIMAVQAAAFSTSTTIPRFQATAAGLPAFPISKCDAIAIAPYLESKRSTTSNAQYVYGCKIGGSDRDAAMAWLDNKLRTNDVDVGQTDFTLAYCTGTIFPTWKTIADAYGVRLTQYEGGWGYIPNLNALTASTYLGNALLAVSVSVTGTANNGSGAIRLTAATATLVDAQSYWVSGVEGTSEANGYWQISVIDGTHLDLVGSTFATAYTTGGLVLSDRDNFYFTYYGTDLFADLLIDLLDGFLAAGGEYPSQYCLVGSWTTSTMWGILNGNMYSSATPTYDAFVEWNNQSEAVVIPYQSPENSAAGAPTIRRRRARYESYDTIVRREKIQEIEALKAAILARGEVAPRLAEKAQEFVPYRDTMSITTLVAELARVQRELEDDENMLVIALLH